MRLSGRCAYLRRAGLQQPGQGGENRDEQEGLFAVKIFLFTTKQIQQGPLRKERVDTGGSGHACLRKEAPRPVHVGTEQIPSCVTPRG